MNLSYERYLDQVLGGWIGKSIGGAIGARFEGYKGWIEIDPATMFPDKMPPNDDLDLQILWLKVLEEKGAGLTSDDMAAAWLQGCWYPFNEYGIFRRNWKLGIHPPHSGRFTNQFWETGMGCPIRSEIWGYVFPGAPDLAAQYATLDGTLDHSEQSVGAEKMFAAMAAQAFFVPDIRRLAAMFLYHLPQGSPIARLTQAAFQFYDQGLSLREARDRLMMLEGLPEACDSQINVPFTFLGLLYGGGDMEKTLLSALACGYDTDCTLATAAAFVGQILGASRIPEALKRAVGDELVMGIEYRRPEMTLTALARDTARVGVLVSQERQTRIEITGTPALLPLNAPPAPDTTLSVDYVGLPAAAPGDRVDIIVHVRGKITPKAKLEISGPPGWTFVPQTIEIDPLQPDAHISLYAPSAVDIWPMKNLFSLHLSGTSSLEYTFGVAGAGLWQFLGAYYAELPDPNDPVQRRRSFNHHFVSLQRDYLPEPHLDVDELYRTCSQTLGRPARLASYEHEVDPAQLIGLRGPFCAYLARTLISPEEKLAHIVVGNTDGYRLYLNGELVAEVDEYVAWTPFNNVHPVTLQAGANQLLLKLLKCGDHMKFTLGLRARQPGEAHHNQLDWLVDLVDSNPG